jgi:hypothetical protein
VTRYVTVTRRTFSPQRPCPLLACFGGMKLAAVWTGPSSCASDMEDDTQVIAIFLDDGAEAAASSEIDFTATSCLLRAATGEISIKSRLTSDDVRRCLESSGVFRRGTPIVDPHSGEVIGYELEEDASIRVAVG